MLPSPAWPYKGIHLNVAELKMIVSCPACETRYIVAEAEIGTRGRAVRCSRCAHTWRAEGVGEEMVEMSSAPDLEVMSLRETRDELRRETRRRAPPPPPPRSSGLGWALLLLVLVGGGAGFYLGRLQIVQAWPQSIVAYETLHIPLGVAGEGFDLRDVTSQRRDDARVLVIEGTLINTTPDVKAVPALKAIVSAKDRPQALKEWVFAPQVGPLEGGAAGGFRVELADLPPAAINLVVTFAEKGEH